MKKKKPNGPLPTREDDIFFNKLQKYMVGDTEKAPQIPGKRSAYSYQSQSQVLFDAEQHAIPAEDVEDDWSDDDIPDHIPYIHNVVELNIEGDYNG